MTNASVMKSKDAGAPYDQLGYKRRKRAVVFGRHGFVRSGTSMGVGTLFALLDASAGVLSRDQEMYL